MNKLTFSLLITFLAGISTVIGIIPTFINKKYQDETISFSLAFSAGVMLTISYLSLIPEALYSLKNYLNILPLFLLCFVFIFIGTLISKFLDNIVNKKLQSDKLYKLGLFSIIALILHNIPEGITTFITTSNDLSLGLSLAFAIALHNIPEGITIAVPIYYSSNKRGRALLYTAIAGFSEFLGAIFACLFLQNLINDFLLSFILALTAGFMIHISICELLPNSFMYKKRKSTFLGLILGILVMLICEFFF